MKPKKKYLSRTGYRTLRRVLVIDCIGLLMNILILKKQDLENIKLAYFKKLKKTIENREFD